MPDENKRDDPTTNPQAQPPLQSPVTPATPLQGALPDSGEGNANEEKNEAKELAREFRIAEKWVIGTNIVLAVIGIIALCIYYGQLRVMRGQLGEIIKQYPEIKKSADAAKSAADAATNQTILMKQQLIGTMSSSFVLNGPELVGNKVRIGWAKTGQVISPEFHASFHVSEASFPSLKQSWESQLYNIGMKPMPSSFSDKYEIPDFAPSDRQFPTQKHTIIVKGEFSFDDGFGQIFNRQFCTVYFGMYQYSAINEGGSVTAGGFQDCKDFEKKLIQFRRRELP